MPVPALSPALTARLPTHRQKASHSWQRPGLQPDPTCPLLCQQEARRLPDPALPSQRPDATTVVTASQPQPTVNSRFQVQASTGALWGGPRPAGLFFAFFSFPSLLSSPLGIPQRIWGIGNAAHPRALLQFNRGSTNSQPLSTCTHTHLSVTPTDGATEEADARVLTLATGSFIADLV